MTRVNWHSITRLLVAHHPRCHPYRQDVYQVGGVALCLGCFTAYPIAAALFVSLVLLHPPLWWAWFAGGVAAGSTQGLAITGWTTTRRRKVLVKVALGIGLALTMYGVLTSPWSVGWRMAALLLGASVAGLAMIPRGTRMRSTCADCLFQGDWERCIGMSLVHQDPASDHVRT